MAADRCARVILSAARVILSAAKDLAQRPPPRPCARTGWCVILSAAKDLAQRRISRPHRLDDPGTALPPGLLHRIQRLGTRTHTEVDAPGAAIVTPSCGRYRHLGRSF